MNAKKHWENVYKTKSPDSVSWYQNEPTHSLKLISDLPIAFNNNIIDIGGGTSKLVDCLLDRGFRHIDVLDISENAIAVSQKRLGRRAENVSWHPKDITSFEATKTYSLWHDRAVFHFLTTPKEIQAYKQTLQKALKPNGYAVIATFAINGPLKCSGLEIVQYDAELIRQELGGSFELINQIQEIHVTPQNKHQLFNYFVFKRLNG